MAGGCPAGAGVFAWTSLLLVGFSAANGCSVSGWLLLGAGTELLWFVVGDFAAGFSLPSIGQPK